MGISKKGGGFDTPALMCGQPELFLAAVGSAFAFAFAIVLAIGAVALAGIQAFAGVLFFSVVRRGFVEGGAIALAFAIIFAIGAVALAGVQAFAGVLFFSGFGGGGGGGFFHFLGVFSGVCHACRYQAGGQKASECGYGEILVNGHGVLLLKV
jgi:hypothetical protein